MSAPVDTTAFPTLTPAQLARLADYGEESTVAAQTSLFVEGQSSYDLIVILDGEADIIWVDAATELEARVCGTNPVTVIGGGNSAGQAAIHLAQQGAPVTIAIRGADLTSSMSTYLIDRIDAAANITVAPFTEVVALHGESRLTEVTLRDNRSGAETRQACAGLFSFIGAVPFTDWLAGFVELDEHGFILTGSELSGIVDFDPLPFETSRPGVFAAGDVRASSMKRVAAAVGDGSSAIRSVHQRLAAP